MSSEMLKNLKKWESTFFPKREIFNNKISTIKQLILFVILFILFSFSGIIFRPGGLIGFDWIHFYGQGIIPPFYPPWTKYAIEPLTWSLLKGLTLASFSLAVFKRSVHPVSISVAFFSLPLMWTIFLGQLEGIVLFGLLGIPWLVPLALVKPQVSIFAFGASRKYFLVAIIFLLFSLIVWGFWPINTLKCGIVLCRGALSAEYRIGILGFANCIGCNLVFPWGHGYAHARRGVFIATLDPLQFIAGNPCYCPHETMGSYRSSTILMAAYAGKLDRSFRMVVWLVFCSVLLDIPGCGPIFLYPVCSTNCKMVFLFFW